MTEREEQATVEAFHRLYNGEHAERLRQAGDSEAMPPWAEVYWLGRQVVKSPIDLWTYQEILWETKPDLLIETGTSGGGSASYFAHIFDILNHGQIMTVDTVGYPLPMCPEHPRIEYLRGSSVDLDIAERIQEVAHDKRTMVSLDSLHTYKHVAREIELYAPLVSSGCYLVVEDTGMGGFQSDWCSRAVSELLARDSSFSVDLSREKHLFTSNHNGWLRKQ